MVVNVAAAALHAYQILIVFISASSSNKSFYRSPWPNESARRYESALNIFSLQCVISRHRQTDRQADRKVDRQKDRPIALLDTKQ